HWPPGTWYPAAVPVCTSMYQASGLTLLSSTVPSSAEENVLGASVGRAPSTASFCSLSTSGTHFSENPPAAPASGTVPAASFMLSGVMSLSLPCHLYTLKVVEGSGRYAFDAPSKPTLVK